MDKKILVVLPAYNEAKVIGPVIKGIISEGYSDVLVIDDASKDDTGRVAREAGAIVLRHVINRKGPGAPTFTGITYAKRNGYDYVVLMDSDGQHSPKDIKRLMKFAKKYDVVIGSRMIDNEGMPASRKVANFVGSVVTWFFFGLFVRDSQSGFKVLNRKAIERVEITYDTYEFCSEMIGEIKRNNLSFVEVPIKVIYTEHSLSRGRGQSIRNGFRMLWRFFVKH